LPPAAATGGKAAHKLCKSGLPPGVEKMFLFSRGLVQDVTGSYIAGDIVGSFTPLLRQKFEQPRCQFPQAATSGHSE
jgi:hypothetical protein